MGKETPGSSGNLSKDRLTHIQNYEKDRPYACKFVFEDGTKCLHRYKKGSSLKEHKESKHEGKRYTCDKCGQKFISHGVLVTHRKVKHSDEKFVCSVCAEEFTTIKGLRTHRQVHWESRHKCPECDNVFESEEGLQIHVASFHRNEKRSIALSSNEEDTVFSQESHESQTQRISSISTEKSLKFSSAKRVKKTIQSCALLAHTFSHKKEALIQFVKYRLCADETEDAKEFDEIVSSVGYSMFHKGTTDLHKKNDLQRTTSKKDSLKFTGAECYERALIAKSLLQFIYLIKDYMAIRIVQRSKEDQEIIETVWTQEDFDFNVLISISDMDKKLFTTALFENGLTVLLETQQEYSTRTGEDMEKFFQLRYPAFVSASDQDLGKIYLVYTILDNICYAYVGKNLSVKGQNSRRHSAHAHRCAEYTWEVFCNEKNVKEYYEDVIYYNADAEATTDPLGERCAIEAFFLMQFKDFEKTLHGTKVQKLVLLNKKLIKGRWSKDIFRAINIVSLWWGQVRINYKYEGETIDVIPKSESIRKNLGATSFT